MARQLPPLRSRRGALCTVKFHCSWGRTTVPKQRRGHPILRNASIVSRRDARRLGVHRVFARHRPHVRRSDAMCLPYPMRLDFALEIRSISRVGAATALHALRATNIGSNSRFQLRGSSDGTLPVLVASHSSVVPPVHSHSLWRCRGPTSRSERRLRLRSLGRARAFPSSPPSPPDSVGRARRGTKRRTIEARGAQWRQISWPGVANSRRDASPPFEVDVAGARDLRN